MFNDLGFRSTSSLSGAYEGQTRNFIVGGSVSARARNKTAQLFQVTPPNIKSGCGGIDLFFGGFSFINAQEFNAFLQAVGQNAIGYAFNMALGAICPSCKDILSELRNLASAVNDMAGLESCRTAQLLGDKIGVMTGILKEGQSSTNVPEKKTDPISGWLKMQTEKIKDFNKKIYDASKESPLNSKLNPGVPTAQAIAGYDLSESEAELIVSILGTKAPRFKNPEEDGIECVEFPAVLSIKELLEGSSNDTGKVHIYYCEEGNLRDGSCKKLNSRFTNFTGNKIRVREWMYRIRDKYESGGVLSVDEKNFISSTPVPPVARIIETSLQHSPQLANIMIESTADIAAIFYSAATIETYGRMYAKGVNKISTCSEEDGMKRFYDTLTQLYQDMSKYSQTIETQVNFLQFLTALEARVLAMSSHKITNATKRLVN